LRDFNIHDKKGLNVCISILHKELADLNNFLGIAIIHDYLHFDIAKFVGACSLLFIEGGAYFLLIANVELVILSDKFPYFGFSVKNRLPCRFFTLKFCLWQNFINIGSSGIHAAGIILAWIGGRGQVEILKGNCPLCCFSERYL
jgi:hypothetical protein